MTWLIVVEHYVKHGEAIMNAGDAGVRAYITHGILTGDACQKIEKSVLDELVILIQLSTFALLKLQK